MTGSPTPGQLPPPPPLGPPGAGDNGGEGQPYPQSNVILAVVLTIFVPFIALVAALVLRGSERVDARRRQLQTWALASGAFLALGLIIGIAVIASVAGSSGGLNGGGGCKGGIDHLQPPSYIEQGHQWQATYSCTLGGSVTRNVKDPFGGTLP